MDAAVIVAGFAIVNGLTFAIGFFLIRNSLERKADDVRAFFMPNGEQPSEFAKIIGVIGDDFAGRVVGHAKSTFMGVQSGVARGEKALTGAISQDLVTMDNPLAGAIIQSFPAVRKLVNRNPELAAMLPGIIEKFAGKGTGAPVPSNGNGASKFGKF